MSAPNRRRREPQSIDRGWELAVASVGGVVLAVVLAALTGVGVAAALWGGGWVWPLGTDSVTSVVSGLLHGDLGQGFTHAQARRLAGPVPTYVAVAVAEVVLLVVAVAGLMVVRRHVLPSDSRGGMATRSEAANALGVRQLRSARFVIRPDRYGGGSQGPP